MKNWLQKQYLSPKGMPYIIIEILNQHFLLIIGLMTVLILAIPIFNLIHKNHQANILQQENHQTDETLNQKEKLFLSIQARQKKLNSQDINITQINQKLAELFNTYQIENENMQWDFSNGKSITISLAHKATTLFSLIDTFSRFPNLRIKELTLNKLDESHLVQLNINLQLVAIEEE